MGWIMYMGTVSLKHINNVNAEFAISIRRTAMGKGYARYAMMSILKMAGNYYGLDYVYWCVNPDNKRAIRFYEKNGYARTNHTEIDIRGVQSRTNSKIYLVQVYSLKSCASCLLMLMGGA